ncbi:hypothetical protein JJ680_20340 [Klebsiella pneumoniae]|nr:hypothetical protein JJ680_20340 [Klebsiella pneumoniae]
MTIAPQAVNELIASLESAGELSIREQKFLKLAKAFKQLAAENVALRESRNNLAEFIHEELDADYPLNMNLETHATDHIVAGIKADGVEEFAAKLRIPGDDQFFDALAKGVALAADDFAKQLREGADK